MSHLAGPGIINPAGVNCDETKSNASQVQRAQSPSRWSYLILAPEVIPRQSIRSLYFDLLDLPPIAARGRDLWESGHKPYEGRVDQLLDDPRYGRHGPDSGETETWLATQTPQLTKASRVAS